jgi:hypothetical protein
MTHATTPGKLTDMFVPHVRDGETLQGIFLCRERWISAFGGGVSFLRASFGLRRYFYVAITDQRVLMMRVSSFRGFRPGPITGFPRGSVHCKRCVVRRNLYTIVDLQIDGRPGELHLLAPAGGSRIELWSTLK